MTGWIWLHRRLLQHPLWTRHRFTPGQAWVDLLLQANFHDGKVHQGNVWIPVKRGQVFTSKMSLAKRWGWNRKTVSGFLLSLNLDNMLDIETSRRTDTGYTLLTIRNYGQYQGTGSKEPDIQAELGPDIQADIERTSTTHPLPTSEESNKREAGPKRPRKASDAAHGDNGKGNGKAPVGYEDAVQHWFSEFERTRGGKPQFSQVEGACLKRVLGSHAVGEVKAVMSHMLTRTQLKHIRERHAYTLHSLVGSWNELWSEYRRRAVEEGENA